MFVQWCFVALLSVIWYLIMSIYRLFCLYSIPSFLARHNGKPALVTKSGTFTRYSNYIEMSVNIRYWAFIANKGIHALLPKVKDVVLNIGATIEGRKDDELPEILIGACRVMRLDLSKIMTNHTIV